MEASDIIAAVDMGEYLSQYMDFEQKGRELWSRSCFTTERTPSFSYDPAKRYFYDFSAGFGGNLVDFVMAKEKCSVAQAIRILKNYANITDDSEAVPSQKVSMVSVAKRYRRSTRPPPKCTAKILPDDYMDRYEFRTDKLKIWNDEGIPFEVMRDYGVRYDAFDDRIVYPVRNMDGKIFCVSGRTCDPDYKAKKIRKYTYTSPIGSLPTLYGYWENKTTILSSREALVFEGCKSVLKAVSYGFNNGIALLTSHLSPFQLEAMIKLASFHGIHFVFALDSDVDITLDKNIMRLKSYAHVEWIKNRGNLLSEKDSPVDCGKEVFEKLYREREILS